MIVEELKLATILLEILKENYLIQPDKLKEKYWDIPLTGKHFGLSGFELAALVLEFEKRTGKKIDIHANPIYALASINGITKVV